MTACHQNTADTELTASVQRAPPNKLSLPIYLYQGYEEAIGKKATDDIFQDFSTDSGNLGYIWSDTDATLHNSTDNGWIKGLVVRHEHRFYALALTGKAIQGLPLKSNHEGQAT